MDRRTFVIGFGSIAGGLSAAMGTGAFSAARVERDANIQVTNDADALIGLIPNDDIAGVELVDGQLAITLDDPGINVNSVYQFGAFVEDGTSDETLDNAVGDRFDPVTYDEPFDPVDNFRSAFMVRNQTSEDLDVKMTLQITDDDWDNEPKYFFQVHDDDGLLRNIYPAGGFTVPEGGFPMKSGEAVAVSFAIRSLSSDVGDSLSGTISVDAGEAVD